MSQEHSEVCTDALREIDVKYVEMLRETKAAAMGRVMPLDIQLQAAKLVKADDDELQEEAVRSLDQRSRS
jgi:hypothetical protein